MRALADTDVRVSPGKWSMRDHRWRERIVRATSCNYWWLVIGERYSWAAHICAGECLDLQKPPRACLPSNPGCPWQINVLGSADNCGTLASSGERKSRGMVERNVWPGGESGNSEILRDPSILVEQNRAQFSRDSLWRTRLHIYALNILQSRRNLSSGGLIGRKYWVDVMYPIENHLVVYPYAVHRSGGEDYVHK